MAIKLILGLGNPGPTYEKTRHNAGAWLVHALAKAKGSSFKTDKKMQAELAELTLNQSLCRLALPLTFMNHSGQPGRIISQFYRIPAEELLVVHDELDLPVGRIKLKTGGGHGGHNGLRDLISQLGTAEFHRLRIGIGHPGHRDQVHPYVLNPPSVQDKQRIEEAIERGLLIMPLLLSGDLARAMNQLNT